jgi:hypothetical protein
MPKYQASRNKVLEATLLIDSLSLKNDSGMKRVRKRRSDVEKNVQQRLYAVQGLKLT